MEFNLSFTDNKNTPLPGGFSIIISNSKTDPLFFSAGSRTRDLTTSIDGHTHFRMASISKQYTAVAVLQSAMLKKLQLTDPIGQFFSLLPKDLVDVTIQQLLTHTSGITDYETFITPHRKEQLSDRDVLSFIEKHGSLYFPPGSQFRYSNTGYCLLTQIIEKVSQLSYPQFMERYIFKPNHLLTTSVFETKKDIPNRAYGFKIKDEQAVFSDQNIMSATQGDGGIYTSPLQYKQWIEKLFSGKIIADYSQLLFNAAKVAVKDGVFYNLGWFLSRETDGTRCVFHSGESTGFRNMVYYNPDKKSLILYFSNWEDDTLMAKTIDRLIQKNKIKLHIKRSVSRWLSNVYSF